jgi:hypothetical protein
MTASTLAPSIPRVDGASLLSELQAALTRYVAFPSPEAADATALWVAASHAVPAWEHAPRLVLTSPEKRCGKSRTQDVISETCHRPLVTINATIAAVVRSLSDDPPTLIVDEADTIFGTKKQAENNEDLRGLLNAGYQRGRPMIRWDITSKSVEELGTFAMVCLASILDLPDTIMDRAVVIRMRRRARDERVASYRTRRDRAPLNGLRDRLAAWIRDHQDELKKAEPATPLEDRAADTWEPLLAVADLAGGDWPARARTAAEVLTGTETDQALDGTAGIRLLTDLRQVFGDTEVLWTKTIIDRLHNLEESPWGDWYGRPLTARELAKLLGRYGVRSKDVREGGTGSNLKGYTRADLHDQWVRYIRDEGDMPDETCRGPVADDLLPYATATTSDVAPVARVAEEAAEHPPEPKWPPSASRAHATAGGQWQ